MRIIEPVSKLRTVELLQRYFGISHAQRAVYGLLPQLIHQKSAIETAAYQTPVYTLEKLFLWFCTMSRP